MEEENKNESPEKKPNNMLVNVGIILVILALIGVMVYTILGKGKKSEGEANLNLIPSPTTISIDENSEKLSDNVEASQSANMDFSKYKETKELIIEDTKVGDGQQIKDGDMAVVHYTGYLTNGSKFDSSVDRGAPFAFKLGAGEVIAGWDKGVLGMKMGGIRRLVIPPDMGYGSRDLGEIPANSILIFDVELLKIE